MRRGPLGEPAIAAVVQHQPVQGRGLSEIHLPPGLVFVLRVEAPLAVLDAVHRTRRVLRDGHIAAGRRRSRIPQFQLAKPIGLQLVACHGRLRPRPCRAPRRHAQRQHTGDDPRQDPASAVHVRALLRSRKPERSTASYCTRRRSCGKRACRTAQEAQAGGQSASSSTVNARSPACCRNSAGLLRPISIASPARWRSRRPHRIDAAEVLRSSSPFGSHSQS